MSYDRQYNAEYYDVGTMPGDIDFYSQFVTPDTRVLELGCGTGRVTKALLSSAKRIVGVDRSEAMLARARETADTAAQPFVCDDITTVRLHQEFDLIIAPFRVLQALEHNDQVHGLFDVIRAHLAPDGVAILNVFHPNCSRDEMAEKWPAPEATFCGEVTLCNGDTLRMFDERKHLDAERQVLYPKLIYRRYRDGQMVDEHINPICMRYYYPDQFIDLIETQGFTVIDSWGGYANEPYGEGGELVVAFRSATKTYQP